MFEWKFSLGTVIQIIGLIISVVGLYIKMKQIEHTFNSKMDKFIEEVRSGAFARGLKQGQDENKNA